MGTNIPIQSRESQVVKGRNIRRRLILLAGLLIAALAIAVWRSSEISRANDQPATLTDSVWSEADLTSFTEAFESGDYQQVRALFTEDGVMTTAANIHEAIFSDDISQLANRVDESEFRLIATKHGGEELHILGTPIQVENNTVAFAWRWDSGISGTALLHLRDGKIVICILNPSQYKIPFAGE